MIPGAYHLFGSITGQHLQGLIPMGHHVVPIDNEGRNGAALNDLGKGFFIFIEFPFNLLEPAVAMHHDVSGFTKALIDP